MSETVGSSEVHGSDPGPRRWLWWALAAVAVLAAGVLTIALTSGDDGDAERAVAATTTPATTTSAAPSSAAPSSEAPAPEPTSAAPEQGAGGGDGLPPVLPAVALDQPVEQAGVTGSVVSVRAVDGRPTGPGDVAGPALMVTVRLVNGTSEGLSLDATSVNLFHGADRTPASPLGDPRRSPFTGSLATGASAEGVYVFSVPSGERDRVDVEVGYRPGQPFVIFSGAVR